ncbi:GFA family protein [Sneathiella aquimaris]|uniref:GFA family protein n=1 Tax=Sneathiella aquimaris TaxID=2599305 RepID=UPI00146C825B|nr:GFA family protein [Sneathiella aquimaris]
MSLSGSCHCGTVKFHLEALPNWLTACNCSICRRLGALWIHSEYQQITLECQPSDTLGYSFGPRNRAFHSCILCGCTTHWEGLTEETETRIAVNGLLLPSAVIEPLKIRRFDGAETCQYLDEA